MLGTRQLGSISNRRWRAARVCGDVGRVLFLNAVRRLTGCSTANL